MINKSYEFGFNDELQKIAEEEIKAPKKGEIKEGLAEIARHPLSFAGRTLGGYAAGAGIGSIGGIVAGAPIAAAFALKERRLPKFSGSFKEAFKHHMEGGLKAEMVGGSLAGALMGGQGFFKKHKEAAK